jgi:hypothetical protein
MDNALKSVLTDLMWTAAIVLFTLICGSAFRDLNDGRIETVVKQIVNPTLNSANAQAVSRE